MSTPLAILLAAAVLVFAFLALNRASTLSAYRPAGPLFTLAERAFLGALQRTFNDDFMVFGKVRVADLVSVENSKSKRTLVALNRIAAKHVDFVLCRKNDLFPVCVIELNDRSHSKKDRQSRDAFLDAVFKKVGIPLVWVPVSSKYSSPELRANVFSAINESAAP